MFVCVPERESVCVCLFMCVGGEEKDRARDIETQRERLATCPMRSVEKFRSAINNLALSGGGTEA